MCDTSEASVHVICGHSITRVCVCCVCVCRCVIACMKDYNLASLVYVYERLHTRFERVCV